MSSIEREITEESWGKLSNDDQALYEREGESYKFIGVNPSKLITAKNRERDLANKYKKEFMEYKKSQEQSREGQDEPEPESKPKEAEGSASSAELQKLKRKMDELNKRHQKDIQMREAELASSEMQRHIHNVVSQVFEDAHIGAMILEKRMDVEIRDGKAKLLLKNRDGVVDEDWGVEDLIKDLNTDDRYKHLRKAGLAVGGDDTVAQGAPQAASTASQQNRLGPDDFRMPTGDTPQDQAVINYMQGKSVMHASDEEVYGALQAAGVDLS